MLSDFWVEGLHRNDSEWPLPQCNSFRCTSLLIDYAVVNYRGMKMVQFSPIRRKVTQTLFANTCHKKKCGHCLPGLHWGSLNKIIEH